VQPIRESIFFICSTKELTDATINVLIHRSGGRAGDIRTKTGVRRCGNCEASLPPLDIDPAVDVPPPPSVANARVIHGLRE
jgi:bacterioferritin-associated ferredoxin